MLRAGPADGGSPECACRRCPTGRRAADLWRAAQLVAMLLCRAGARSTVALPDLSHRKRTDMSPSLSLTLPALLTAAALALSACGPTRPDAAPLAVAGQAPAPSPTDRSNPSYPANLGNSSTSSGGRVAPAPTQPQPHPSPVKRAQSAYPDRVETERVESSDRKSVV